MTITVDELVRNKHLYTGKRVEVIGKLGSYHLSSGLLSKPSLFTLEGDRCIT